MRACDPYMCLCVCVCATVSVVSGMSGIPSVECGTLTYRHAVRWEGVSVCVHVTLYCGHTCAGIAGM